MGSAVLEYPHGVVDSVMPGSGGGLPPHWALQGPSDYLEVLRTAVPAVPCGGPSPTSRPRDLATSTEGCLLAGGR